MMNTAQYVVFTLCILSHNLEYKCTFMKHWGNLVVIRMLLKHYVM